MTEGVNDPFALGGIPNKDNPSGNWIDQRPDLKDVPPAESEEDRRKRVIRPISAQPPAESEEDRRKRVIRPI